jgi:hypothetical protein
MICVLRSAGIGASLVVLSVVAVFGFQAESAKSKSMADEFESPKAVKAREEFKVGATKAWLDFKERMRAARKKYVEVLNLSIKQATKAGDLKEAQLLQAALEATAEAEPAVPKADWVITFSHSGDRVPVQFDGNGNVSTGADTGIVRQDDDDWIVEFKSGSVMRFNPDGARFFVEQWGNREDFLRRKPSAYLAIAVRK